MRPLKVLHIEDSEEDGILFTRACEAAGLPIHFYRVEDGSSAMAYLQGTGEFADRAQCPLPDLIILDLKLPGMGGFDFIQWLRLQPDLMTLPILVFTISDCVGDKERAIAEGATGYFTKPKDFKTLVRLAESFRKFNVNDSDKNDEVT